MARTLTKVEWLETRCYLLGEKIAKFEDQEQDLPIKWLISTIAEIYISGIELGLIENDKPGPAYIVNVIQQADPYIEKYLSHTLKNA